MLCWYLCCVVCMCIQSELRLWTCSQLGGLPQNDYCAKAKPLLVLYKCAVLCSSTLTFRRLPRTVSGQLIQNHLIQGQLIQGQLIQRLLIQWSNWSNGQLIQIQLIQGQLLQRTVYPRTIDPIPIYPMEQLIQRTIDPKHKICTIFYSTNSSKYFILDSYSVQHNSTHCTRIN